MVKKFAGKRRAVQLFFAAASNSYLTGFMAGKIYQGNLKYVCAPGLNCYSCPGARLACPIGSLQAVLGSRSFTVSTYVFGFLLVFGALLGRAVCGFLCPFGLLQELLYKIPLMKKVRTFKGDRALRYAKYGFLLFLVILIPAVMSLSGDAQPAFCKYVCPQGALEGGIPLVLYDRFLGGVQQAGAPVPSLAGLSVPGLDSVVNAAALRQSGPTLKVGLLYFWKIGILVSFLLLSVKIYRPFCRYVCPLGAAYAPFNKLALYRLHFDENACVHCGRCRRACNMDLDPVKQLNHAECVRCGDCVDACPTAALSLGFRKKEPQKRPCSGCANA